MSRMRNWDSQRPPSRGGESWQPLGQTSPPAYEQVTPEQFEQFQLICSPREASRHASRERKFTGGKSCFAQQQNNTLSF